MIEIIDSAELAKRWHLPESWIRSKTRSRTPTAEQIPHIQFGRYVRFRWGSPKRHKKNPPLGGGPRRTNPNADRECSTPQK